MPKPRHVFIVGCGFPQLGLIRAARALGIETTGGDLNPNAIGVAEVDHFCVASTGEVKAIVDAFRASEATAMATSGSELALTTVSRATQALGLPFYADEATVYRCQAKHAMRAAYEQANLDIPSFAACSTLDQARDFVRRVGYPVVVKPAHGWGQRGVSRVDDDASLEGYFHLACGACHGGGGAVIEECIVGHEVSVNGWVENGTLQVHCVTDREVFEGHRPLGVMRSEIAPSSLSPSLVERAAEMARRGAQALGLRRGPCYSQVAVSETRAVLFETAARLGGGFDADVTRLYSGVDLYTRLLGVALCDVELEHAGTPSRANPALVRFLKPRPGKLKAIGGLENVRMMPGVIDAVVYAKPGDVMADMTDAAKRIGHLLVVGQSRDEAIARADAAQRAINFVIEPSV